MRKVIITENIRHTYEVSFYEGDEVVEVEKYTNQPHLALDAITNWCESGMLPK